MFNARDMEAIRDFVEYLLKHVGHGYVFCYDVQFVSRWRLFWACMEEVEENVGETELVKIMQTP